MKNLTKILAMLLLVCTVISCCVSCDAVTDLLDKFLPSEEPPVDDDSIDEEPEEHEHIDYVSQLKLDMTSETLKCEVTVKLYVDGDTTHFWVKSNAISEEFVKARYLAINTPESTGKIEEWGKAASKFTRSKLENAVSIIIESDDGNWNIDSTGSRYLLWIWYKPTEDSDYRNLNLEILQEGLAIASNTANNRYGEICMNALNQAKIEKLHVFSGEKDPDFYYGNAYQITLKELRTNVEAYTGANVAIEGVITRGYNDGAYIEAYDEEDEMYYGFYLYYGYNLNGFALEALSVGNYVRVVGSVQYYEAGDSYQISGIIYKTRNPDSLESSNRLDDKTYAPAYAEIDAKDFVNGTKEIVVTVDGEEETKEFALAELLMGTSVSMKNLVVKKVYTTSNEESSQKGAMTLTCEVDGVTVSIRTAVLYDEDGQLVTKDAFLGKTIDVQGLVDQYDGSYQIRILSINDVTFH